MNLTDLKKEWKHYFASIPFINDELKSDTFSFLLNLRMLSDLRSFILKHDIFCVFAAPSLCFT